MSHKADGSRYGGMIYRRCGKSGINLPAISLGLWQNFGGMEVYENSRAMLLRAFDLGITHFDLANNYGPPPGSAEETFGRVLKSDFAPYRDELIVSSKAGFTMWAGPYGDWGSRKYLVASCDQSLARTGLEYLDIFYHHRPDPQTPLEETMQALADLVKQGKALYAGISNYPPDLTQRAAGLLRDMGTPLLIHQPSYSILNRWVEEGLLDVLDAEGVGCMAFAPLSGGRLTDKYLQGIPADSRVGKKHGTLQASHIGDDLLKQVHALNDLARERGQTLAQMALAWVLRRATVTSALIGASRVAQVEDNVAALKNLEFSAEELTRIEGLSTPPAG